MKNAIRSIEYSVVRRTSRWLCGLSAGLLTLSLLGSPYRAQAIPVRAEEGKAANASSESKVSSTAASMSSDETPEAVKPAPIKSDAAAPAVPVPVAIAAGTNAKPAVVDAAAKAPAEVKPHGIRNPLTFGGDLYFGGTNATGVRARNNDGIWAGYGSALPSLLSVNWRQDEVRGMRVSLGVGDMFTSSNTLLRQPLEATYQFPTTGNGSMTVGKFYVPFATQEWEYETKYGMMFQKAHGATSFAGSVNYNFKRQTPNIYLRIGRQFGARTAVGLSAGGGRGVFSDSSHTMAVGLDVAHDIGGAQFSMEYNLAKGAKGAFQFAYGKLTLTKLGRYTPYVGAYYWHDSAQELGQYHSLLAGLSYKISSHVSIEGGYARGNTRNIFWMQSHVTF